MFRWVARVVVESSAVDTGEYGFRHCVVASTWAFEAQGPGSIPGGGAIRLSLRNGIGTSGGSDA